VDWRHADKSKIRLSPAFKTMVSSMLQKDFIARPTAKQLTKTCLAIKVLQGK